MPLKYDDSIVLSKPQFLRFVLGLSMEEPVCPCIPKSLTVDALVPVIYFLPSKKVVSPE